MVEQCSYLNRTGTCHRWAKDRLALRRPPAARQGLT